MLNQNNSIENIFQFSSALSYFSFDEVKSFLLDPNLDPTSFQSHFKNKYDSIKMMDNILTLIADLDSDYADESSFEIFKKACSTLQNLTLKPSLIKFKNINEISNINTIEEFNHSDEAQIISKWWKTYLSLLQEAFEKHSDFDDWCEKNHEWFGQCEHDFLEESLSYLQEFYHWKITLLRTLCGKEDFFKKIAEKGLMKKEFMRNFDAMKTECHKYYSDLAYNHLQIIEKMEADDLTKLMKESMAAILAYFKEDQSIANSIPIKTGYFSKKKVKGLSHSVILAEDGGFFLLLNSLSEEETAILKKNKIDGDYLNNICKAKEGVSSLKKLIIGQGTFGKIRVCLTLSGNETSNLLKAGDVVCCKKTDHFNKKKPKSAKISMSQIRKNCWSDYSVGEISELIYSPEVYDMIIVEPLQGLEEIHCKGYTIQQFLPVLNGDKAFSKKGGPFINNWLHQRAYFLDIFKSISKLLSVGICMTDLKPANTLYNSNKAKGSLIDLSGVVHKKSREDLEKKSRVADITEMTLAFTAPEIKKPLEDENPEVFVDLCKSLAFTLGKMLSDTSFEDSVNKEIRPIIEKLVEEDPKKRISVDEGLELLQKVTPPKLPKDRNFQAFIKKLLEETQKDPSKFGLNSNLTLISSSFIVLEASPIDLEIYPEVNLQFSNLKEDLDDFMNDFNDSQKERTLVLLGASGSGKSTILQLNYLNYLKKWRQGDPIPIFLNLSVQRDLETQWEWLAKETQMEEFSNFNLLAIGQYSVILFVDSFDEAPQKSNYVSAFYQALGNNRKNKAIICCRSEFLQKDEDFLRFFMPKDKETMGTAFKKYIVPIKRSKFQLNEEFIAKYYSIWKTPQENEEFDIKAITAKLMEPTITVLMKTSFMIHISLMVLPQILQEDPYAKVSRNKIYKKYMENIMKRTNPTTKKPFFNHFSAKFPNIVDEEEVWLRGIEEAAMDLARILHINNTGSKIDQFSGAVFLEKFNYSPSISFLSNQILVSVIKGLDLEVEIKGKIPNEQIKLGFSHETIKIYFLSRVFVEESQQVRKAQQKPLCIGRRIITDEEALVRFVAEIIRENEVFKENLINLVLKSKESSEQFFIFAATNAISLLVAANVSFSSKNLSKIKIPGAILRDGQFLLTDFSEADLTGTTLENCKLDGALFDKTILKDVKLGVFPEINANSSVNSCRFNKEETEILCSCGDGSIKIYKMFDKSEKNRLFRSFGDHEIAIFSPNGKEILTNSGCSLILWERSSGKFIKAFEGHSDTVNCIAFSRDSKNILSSSSDKTIRIWDKSSGNLIRTLEGASSKSMSSAAFSHDGKQVLSAADDDLVKLWEISTGNCQKTFEYCGSVNSVAFSPDGKCFLSGSEDKLIKLWEISTEKLLKTFECHKGSVNSVAFSANGEEMLCSSADNRISLWNVSVGNLIRFFESHSGSVLSAVFSPDDKYILSASKDQSIKLWEKATGTLLKSLEVHTGIVNSVAFSPDGQHFLSGSKDKTVKLWQISTLNVLKTFESHTGSVICTAFSPDGNHIVSCSWDNTIKIWSKTTGILAKSLNGHTQTVNSVDFSPDGQFILSGSSDNMIKLWDFSTGSAIKTYKGHADAVNCVVFSNDGKYFLSASRDATIKLWEKSTGILIKTFEGHCKSVNSAAFSPDGQLILSGSDDKTVKIWEKDKGSIVKTLESHFSQVKSVAFSPDGLYILSGSEDKTIKLWEKSSGFLIKTLEGHSDWVNSVCFSPSGRFILSGSNDYIIKFWEKTTGKLLKSFEGHSNSVNSIAFSPDGQHFMSGSNDFTVKLWEKSSGALIKVLQGHNDEVNCVACSTDNAYIVSGSKDGKVNLWDKLSGKLIKTLEEHTDYVNSVAFSPDSKCILTGSADRTVKLWEISTKTLIKSLESHSDSVQSVAFSPDGKYVLSASNDKTINLWEKSTGELIKTLKGHCYLIHSITFSPNGKLIASGSYDDTIKIWENPTGMLMVTFEGHKKAVRSVAFSPDNRYIVSGSNDNTIILWDYNKKKLLATLEGHTDSVNSVAFSPDGKSILSASNDKSIKIWEKYQGSHKAFEYFANSKSKSTNIHDFYVCSVTLSAGDTQLSCKNLFISNVVGISSFNMQTLENFGSTYLDSNFYLANNSNIAEPMKDTENLKTEKEKETENLNTVNADNNIQIEEKNLEKKPADSLNKNKKKGCQCALF